VVKVEATVVSPKGRNSYKEEVELTAEKIGVLKQLRITAADGYTTVIPVGPDLIDQLRWMLRDTRD